MNLTDTVLEFDVEAACNRVIAFIEERQIFLKRDGVLIGLSGGLDSATVAFLTTNIVPKEKITLLYLPDKDSKKHHKEDARLIANQLGIPLKMKSLTPLLGAVDTYKLLPLRFLPGQRLKAMLVAVGKFMKNITEDNLLSARLTPEPDSLVAKGNAYGMIKHRMRMVIFYYYANIKNLMVIGAANKTEWLTGTFTQWGCDQCADIMPIIHLYRSQVEILAKYLGVPEQVLAKPADPDIIPGVADKGKLLGSFLMADQILWNIEHEVPEVDLNKVFGTKNVRRIRSLYEGSTFMREAPYSLMETA